MRKRWSRSFVTLVFLAAAACGGPARATFARYPGAPAAFEPAGSDPQAIALATKVFETAGGAHWSTAHQIRWTQTLTYEGKPPLAGEEAWDRWNGRHWGKLHQGEHDIVAFYELYGTYQAGYSESKEHHRVALQPGDRANAVEVAKKRFNLDTAMLCMPFLLEEPGVKLALGGPVQDGDKTYDELVVTFPAADATRGGAVFHAFVDKETNLIHRLEVEKAGSGRMGYVLRDYAEVGGLKLPMTRENLGDAKEITKVENVTVGEADDELFVPPIS